jgi:photosystem II stability/assembly factor-like uncharacterized protein
MQRIILLFTSMIFLLGNSQAQWTNVTTGTSSMYESMYFFDASNGIASSTTDVIKTSNGGNSWTIVNTTGIKDMDFANSTVGYAAGLSGTSLYKTTNGGTSWTALIPVSSNIMWGVSVVDANTVYVSGSTGAVWKSTNGGTSFSAVNVPATNTIVDLDFINANEGCAVEVTGNIWHTTNGGTNWSIAYATVGIYFSSIYFVDSSTGYAVGSNGTIIKTTDGGASWTTLTTNSMAYFQYVHFCDANHGMAVGLNATILRTNNGGATWFTDSPPTSMSLYSCFMISATSAVAGGISGTMIKNSAMGVDENPNPFSEEISVFPNPSKDIITVDIPSVSSSACHISVYNEQGQLMNSLEYSSQMAEINISGLENGIYYLKIESEDRIGVKKIIKE